MHSNVSRPPRYPLELKGVEDLWILPGEQSVQNCANTGCDLMPALKFCEHTVARE